MFCKKVVLRNFAKFTGKHLCQRLFCNKVAGLSLRPATLLENVLAQVFSCEFCEISKKTFFYRTLRWLLLAIPHFLYALITKQVHNQMSFRVGQNFQVFRAQILLLIMLSFLSHKTECFT